MNFNEQTPDSENKAKSDVAEGVGKVGAKDVDKKDIMKNIVDKVKKMSNDIEKDDKMSNNIDKDNIMSNNIDKDNIMSNNIDKDNNMSNNIDKDNNMSNNIENKDIVSNNVESAVEKSADDSESTVDNNAESKEEGNSLGKFKDAESLLKAYNSLQSEFTKRCQRVKELEIKLSEKESENADKTSANAGENTTPKEISEKQKEEILKEYLRGVLIGKKKAIVLSGEGVGVKTPTVKPKTLSEAGNVAIRLFTEKN